MAAEFGQILFGNNRPQTQAQTCCGNGVQGPSVQQALGVQRKHGQAN